MRDGNGGKSREGGREEKSMLHAGVFGYEWMYSSEKWGQLGFSGFSSIWPRIARTACEH